MCNKTVKIEGTIDNISIEEFEKALEVFLDELDGRHAKACLSYDLVNLEDWLMKGADYD